MGFWQLILASLAASAVADYDILYFTSKVSNWQCSGLGFECPPPSACAHDALIDKYYCCGPGADAVCWTGSTDCSGGNSTTAGDGQTDCGSFCCLGDRERCTQRTGQINICWATAADPFSDVTENRMNDTFSSISSSRPSATSFTFSLARVTGATATSSSASQTSGSTTTTSSTTSPTAAGGAGSHSGISGGAIAGIVIGVVAGLALIAVAAFFILRSRRGKSVTPHQEPYRQSAYAEKHQYSDATHQHPGPQTPLAEMDAGPQSRPVQEWYGHQAAEMESNASGTYRSHQSAELPAQQ